MIVQTQIINKTEIINNFFVRPSTNLSIDQCRSVARGLGTTALARTCSASTTHLFLSFLILSG